MRIVQAVGWYFPDSLGGTEVYVAGLCRRLRAAGQEVLVAAPDAAHAEVRMYEHDGVPVFRYPISSSPTRDEVQGRVPVRGAEHFHRWLADRRPDVVHAHTFVTGLGLAELKAAKDTGARVVVTTHAANLGWICQRGTMMRWGERLCDGLCRPVKCAACALHARGLPKALAWPIAAVPAKLARGASGLRARLGTALAMRDLIARNQAMQREMLQTVDRFVLLTAWALEAAVANGAPRERLTLNRLGLSQEKVTPKPGPEQRPTLAPVRVGYLGRFEPIKGARDLARAVAATPDSVPITVEFRGPACTESDRRVQGEIQTLLGGDPRVTFAPPVASAAALDALASYDVLVCPSLTLEGGPTVAIEAHAVGTPVIGTRIGGLAELVTDGVNGRLVAPGDWRGLAEAIATAAVDPAGTIDRWRRALPAARTMEQIAADYLALYAP